MILTIGLSVTVFAQDADKGSESNEPSSGRIIETTQEQRDQQFDRMMAQIMLSLETQTATKGPQYHYKTENHSYQYKTVSGYAGNQVAGGYRFQTGGGLWYSESGGPSISGSISLTFHMVVQHILKLKCTRKRLKREEHQNLLLFMDQWH